MERLPLRPLEWIASSKDDLRALPGPVKEHLGFALYQAQIGMKHRDAKPMLGMGSGVLEVVSRFDKGTYRAMYTVRFAEAVYVLHVFQKKSKHGIATPKAEIDLIRDRLKIAEHHYRVNYTGKRKS